MIGQERGNTGGGGVGGGGGEHGGGEGGRGTWGGGRGGGNMGEGKGRGEHWGGSPMAEYSHMPFNCLVRKCLIKYSVTSVQYFWLTNKQVQNKYSNVKTADLKR